MQSKFQCIKLRFLTFGNSFVYLLRRFEISKSFCYQLHLHFLWINFETKQFMKIFSIKSFLECFKGSVSRALCRRNLPGDCRQVQQWQDVKWTSWMQLDAFVGKTKGFWCQKQLLLLGDGQMQMKWASVSKIPVQSNFLMNNTLISTYFSYTQLSSKWPNWVWNSVVALSMGKICWHIFLVSALMSSVSPFFSSLYKAMQIMSYSTMSDLQTAKKAPWNWILLGCLKRCTIILGKVNNFFKLLRLSSLTDLPKTSLKRAVLRMYCKTDLIYCSFSQVLNSAITCINPKNFETHTGRGGFGLGRGCQKDFTPSSPIFSWSWWGVQTEESRQTSYMGQQYSGRPELSKFHACFFQSLMLASCRKGKGGGNLATICLAYYCVTASLFANWKAINQIKFDPSIFCSFFLSTWCLRLSDFVPPPFLIWLFTLNLWLRYFIQPLRKSVSSCLTFELPSFCRWRRNVLQMFLILVWWILEAFVFFSCLIMQLLRESWAENWGFIRNGEDILHFMS